MDGDTYALALPAVALCISFFVRFLAIVVALAVAVRVCSEFYSRIAGGYEIFMDARLYRLSFAAVIGANGLSDLALISRRKIIR